MPPTGDMYWHFAKSFVVIVVIVAYGVCATSLIVSGFWNGVKPLRMLIGGLMICAAYAFEIAYLMGGS